MKIVINSQIPFICTSAIRERIARGVSIGVHVEFKPDELAQSWKRKVTEIVTMSGDAEHYVLTPVGME